MKKFLCMVLCGVLLFLNISGAYASREHTFQILADDGRLVNFTINSDIKEKISIDILRSLASRNADTDNIIIYEFGYAKPFLELSGNSNVKPAGLPVVGIIVTKYERRDVFESDRFMDSCAKGETKTITKTIKEELNLEVTGFPVGSTGLKGNITHSITKGQTLVGPPEGSPYNCREYRCEFYQNEGIWTQPYWPSGIEHDPVILTGKFYEPSYYYSYSKDIYIR